MRLPKRTLTASLVALVSATLLAGCAQGITASAPAEQKFVASSALTRQQAATILADVEKVVAAANAKKDAKLLQPRVANPALEVRSRQYQVAAADPFTQISFQSDSYTPSTAVTWPRSLVVASKSSDKKAAAMLLLTQAGAREPYKLVNFGRIFPGEKIELIRTDIGAQQYSDTAKDFLVTPKDALNNYAGAIADNNKAGALHVKKDVLMQAANADVNNLRSALGEKGTVKFSATPGQIQGVVAAPNKHALVFATVYLNTEIATRGNATEVKLTGPMAILLGNDGVVKKKAELKRIAMVTLDVPPANSKEQIRAIAAEMVPLSAKEIK